MTRKKDDFEKQLEGYLEDPEFARAFEEETHKLRLALRISELREKRGMTQKDLAKKLNTTQSVISRLESAQYESYSIKTLKKVAEALHCELVIDFRLC